MKYAITLSSFRHLESLDETLSRLSTLGFDSVEMYGEPTEIDIHETTELLESYDIPVCGVTGMWGGISSEGWKRRLLSQDPGILRSAMEYVRDCVRLCSALGGSEFNVCLFAEENSSTDRTHRTTPDSEKEKMTSKIAPLLSELCNYSENLGVTLLLEPLNRYSTPYCASSKDAARIAELVDMSSFRILLDTFHMNIEEDSFEEAFQNAKKYLHHMHFADNNRRMPGFAHIDFVALTKAMRRIGYDRIVSFEPNISQGGYEQEVKSGLEFIRTKLAV
ncbi:MAG TPA: sugar phosphate isomerase/epimerase family protein [Nitrososphaera sp.]|jgi:sugar phosphate isomerase/epimerase|nr:sugar phosphate isomerase/epimerase family protein [Nitrososphaera sp.]